MSTPILPNGYRISTDRAEMQQEYIHHYLSLESYWAKGRSMEVVALSIQHSFCAGIFYGDQQVAFGRTITDYSTYGYLADVFVDPAHRGKEFGKCLVEVLLNDPALAKVPKFSLRTLDAQGLYAQFGFCHPEFPDRVMDYKRPDSY